MGLDMYLTAERYVCKYFDAADSTKITAINEIFNIAGEDGNYGVQSVIFKVAYWRKANAIHHWFVENCQEGVDECHKAYVSREQLQTLLDLCKEIVAIPKNDSKLLPTANGFFFGSTEYDTYYMQDIIYTVERLEKILKDSALEKCEFYYQSSW